MRRAAILVASTSERASVRLGGAAKRAARKNARRRACVMPEATSPSRRLDSTLCSAAQRSAAQRRRPRLRHLCALLLPLLQQAAAVRVNNIDSTTSIKHHARTQFPPWPAYHRSPARTCDDVVFTRASGPDVQTAPSRCTAQAPKPTAVTTRAANQPANASSIFSHDRAPYAAQSTSIHTVPPQQEKFCSAGRRWRGLPAAPPGHGYDDALRAPPP